MKKAIRKIGLILVLVMISSAFTGCFSFVPNIANNVNESKISKDKSVLAELRQATIVSLSNDDYINAESSESGAKVSSDAKLEIADLFDEENGHGIAEAVSSVIGTDCIALCSDMSEGCTVTIYMDGESGKVVLQVESEEYTYYLDEKGEHEGIYSGDLIKK